MLGLRPVEEVTGAVIIPEINSMVSVVLLEDPNDGMCKCLSEMLNWLRWYSSVFMLPNNIPICHNYGGVVVFMDSLRKPS